MEKQETEEVEKVDDLLSTFNSQLKFEQKADQNKTNKRFKPYKSKKRKSKKSTSKV